MCAPVALLSLALLMAGPPAPSEHSAPVRAALESSMRAYRGLRTYHARYENTSVDRTGAAIPYRPYGTVEVWFARPNRFRVQASGGPLSPMTTWVYDGKTLCTWKPGLRKRTQQVSPAKLRIESELGEIWPDMCSLLGTEDVLSQSCLIVMDCHMRPADSATGTYALAGRWCLSGPDVSGAFTFLFDACTHRYRGMRRDAKGSYGRGYPVRWDESIDVSLAEPNAKLPEGVLLFTPAIPSKAGSPAAPRQASETDPGRQRSAM